jgi:retron-type reverse transcriptase
MLRATREMAAAKRFFRSAMAAKLALKSKVTFCVQGVISPTLANLSPHYAFDMWMTRTFPAIPFERYADD